MATVDLQGLTKIYSPDSPPAVDGLNLHIDHGELVALLERVLLELEYCTIRSPIDGRAGQRLVDVGNIVAPNSRSLLVIQRLFRGAAGTAHLDSLQDDPAATGR